MLYIFLLYKDWSLPEPPNVMEQHETVTARAQGRDGYICSAGLESFTSATTVRVRAGKAAVTDGPFAETKEVLGGIYVLDCVDLDDALEYAKQIPDARFGAVEVRPIKYPEEAWLKPARP